MIWTDLIENPQALSSLFGTAPSLDNVRVSEITFAEGGPTISLSVELNEFPADPPQRWKKDLANAVVLKVQLLGIQSIEVSGWTTENIVSFRFERQQLGTITVQAIGLDFTLRCSCSWIRIDKVCPYQRASGSEYA